MSTLRVRAKEVKIKFTVRIKSQIQNRWHRHFETEDGKKFEYFSSYSMTFNKDTKFFILKHSGDHNSVEYKYWIYPIPYEVATTNKFYSSGEHLNWFSGPRNLVVQVK